ncbi:MAG: 2-phosphosulfolactate phosphatase, partial [Bacteroidia bacterium]|nr:2-phosphosulfolactate phosphatase [Bacteroidia bacterium]
MHQKKIEVCLSPDLFHLYEDIENKVVVITDILRATSTICSAFNRGAEKVIPVASVEEAQELKNKGLRVAAERNGKTVEGFEFGNSPAQLTNYDLTNETFVITTTNGTKAIDLSKKASQIIIGSFLNLAATCEFLKEKNKDIIC